MLHPLTASRHRNPSPPPSAQGLETFIVERVVRFPGRDMALESLCPKKKLLDVEFKRLLPGYDLIRFLEERPRVFVVTRPSSSWRNWRLSLFCDLVAETRSPLKMVRAAGRSSGDTCSCAARRKPPSLQPSFFF